MKTLAAFLIFIALVAPVHAKNGSFLILKSAYLYEKKTQKGKKTLTREKKAYEVTDIYIASGSSLMFRIMLPDKKNEINGTGFIVETESELNNLGLKEVKVYPDLPESKSNLTSFYFIPSNQVTFTGKTSISADFPKLVWKAVNFKASIPSEVWVPEWAGIYRPSKDAAWLNKTYDSLVRKKLDKILEEKILTGQVDIGFTKEQVRLSLGDPSEEHLMEDDTKLEWIYPGHKIIFLNGTVSRVL